MTSTMPHAREASEMYDSDRLGNPVVHDVRALYRYRGLLRLLITRDVTLRYKRSWLGVWWTLLNPLLTTGVMWLVFSGIFRFSTPDGAPFILYLTSGVLFLTFFGQGMNTVGQSIVASSNILTKVYVPPMIFAVAAAAAAAVNFAISLVPLVIIALVTGWGVPWTILLVPVPMLATLMVVMGLGLLVATAAIRFADALDLSTLVVTLVGYLTPTFYPISIVPEEYRQLIYLNPLFSYLEVFRSLSYGGGFGPWWAWVTMGVTSVLALVAGSWTFSSRWRRLSVMV